MKTGGRRLNGQSEGRRRTEGEGSRGWIKEPLEN